MTVMDIEPPGRPRRTLRLVFVTGDRRWTDKVFIRDVLRNHPKGTFFLAGGCEGADLIAETEARLLGYMPIRMDAAWGFYGRGAGPIRNRAMGQVLLALRDAGWAITAYAFHDNLADSRGTRDMLGVLSMHQIPYTHLQHE